MEKVRRQFVTLIFLALVAVALMVCVIYCVEQLGRDNEMPALFYGSQPRTAITGRWSDPASDPTHAFTGANSLVVRI